jgi:hypothetical protein
MDGRQRYLLRFSSLRRWHFASASGAERSNEVYMCNGRKGLEHSTLVMKVLDRGPIVGLPRLSLASRPDRKSDRMPLDEFLHQQSQILVVTALFGLLLVATELGFRRGRVIRVSSLQIGLQVTYGDAGANPRTKHHMGRLSLRRRARRVQGLLNIRVSGGGSARGR